MLLRRVCGADEKEEESRWWRAAAAPTPPPPPREGRGGGNLLVGLVPPTPGKFDDQPVVLSALRVEGVGVSVEVNGGVVL